MTQPAASLEIATPEAVALDIDVAGLGHRALAWLIDASIIATTWFTVGFTITVLPHVRLHPVRRAERHGAGPARGGLLLHQLGLRARVRDGVARPDAGQAAAQASRGARRRLAGHVRGPGAAKPLPRRRLPAGLLHDRRGHADGHASESAIGRSGGGHAGHPRARLRPLALPGAAADRQARDRRRSRPRSWSWCSGSSAARHCSRPARATSWRFRSRRSS